MHGVVDGHKDRGQLVPATDAGYKSKATGDMKEVDKLRPPEPARTLQQPRIGPKMREIADYVAGSPGCTISDALWAVGISPRDRSSARAPVYRAERAGLIIFDRVRVNLVRIFENERAREIWYLRKELLKPGQPIARIEELQARIDELRAEAARTWIEGLAACDKTSS
jgi:hypothetical protein